MKSDPYESQRRYARRIQSEVRDIAADFPKPLKGKAKREKLESDESLVRHFETCYPNAFPLAWSPDHLRLIRDIERAADVGLLKALAMPRGSGKTTIMVRAGLWALLTGRARYVCIVAATEVAARALLKGIKSEITFNEKLQALYGRELHSFIALEDQPRRCGGQTFKNKKTKVEWLTDRLAFGQIPDVKTSGAVLTTAGITGSIRGQQSTTPTGEIIRPDLCLIDDPQTKESAGSETQCKSRHETMMGDILGMAGPGSVMSAVCSCTVIYQGDLAARLLDRELSPEWQGDKCQMVNRWPDNEDIWDQYATVRAEELTQGGDGTAATAFYVENREEMDRGGEVSWEERKGNAESALQYAYNLRLRDEPAFMAEYQNDPLNEGDESPYDLNAEKIARRTVEISRLNVPAEAEAITAFVDVQKELLFYVVMSWTSKGRGFVMDYGTFPDQKRRYFTKADIRYKLSELPGVTELSEAHYAGLEGVSQLIFERQYVRADGAEMPVNIMAIDANWAQSTQTINRFCAESRYKGRLYASMGQYIGVNSKPWQKLAMGNRDQLGTHCRLQWSRTRRARELMIDVNWWKTYVAERLINPPGGDRSIVLFDAKPHEHRMFAEHCCAEDAVLAIGNAGNRLVEWRTNPGKPNNDYWDCLVGNACISSLVGVQAVADRSDEKTQPKRRAPTRGKAKRLGKVK